MTTFSDIVAITNSATADAKSAGSTMTVTANSTITEISVQSLTVGNTYAVEISFPSAPSPLKYLVNTHGAPATNGQAIAPVENIPVRIPIGVNTTVTIYTYADTASATCEVGLKWETGNSGQITYSDFLTASIGTSETDCGDISIPARATIKQIRFASRLSIGRIKQIRLYFNGMATPQTYSTGSCLYDAVGTQVQDNAGGIQGAQAIDVNITIPQGTSIVSVYATSQTASNTSAIGLMWV